jgi:hypothetical protein
VSIVLLGRLVGKLDHFSRREITHTHDVGSPGLEFDRTPNSSTS